MNVLVTTGYHLLRDQRGECWTENGSVAYAFWTRYLDVFDAVCVIARTTDVQRAPEDWELVTGPDVAVRPIPDFRSPLDYVRSGTATRSAIREALVDAPAVIARIPCLVGGLATRTLHDLDRPYAAEVLGDPYDSFAPGAFKSRLRPFYRWLFTRKLKQQCRQASAISYVTQGSLQNRYPPAEGAFATNYSSIVLPEECLVERPRTFAERPDPVRLTMVGTLATLYKAPHVLIDAVAELRDRNVQLTLVGGGKHLEELKQRSQSAGVGDRVHFLGQLPSSRAVRDVLDATDIFVLPSFQEGLPRAMIEAMARALPCIGSTAGGIPELLPVEDLVPPGDATALATKIREMADDPDRMRRASERNLALARDYEEQTLRQRRIRLYRHLEETTQAWLTRQGRSVSAAPANS